MIQKCKNCGQWVKAEKRDMAARAFEPIKENLNSRGGLFEKVGDVVGLKQIGRCLDRAQRAPMDLLRGATDAVLGDKYFFCCSCGNTWSEDDDLEDLTLEYEEEQREINLVEELTDRCMQMSSATDVEKQSFVNELQSALPFIQKEKHRKQLFDILAFSQFKLLNATNKALDAVAESLKLMDDPNTHSLKGVIMGKGRTAEEKYKVLQELIQHRGDSLFFTASEMEHYLAMQNQEYVEHFLRIPYAQRKFLVVDDGLKFLPNSFKVLAINDIPTDLQFPDGHPIEKQMYICHPYNNNYYLPIGDYQLMLFHDEVKEMCVLLQGLGAKRIQISDVHSNDSSLSQERNLKMNAGGENKTSGAGVSGELFYESDEYLRIKSELCRTQECEIRSIFPCVPEGLVWYSHRIDWQRMAQQRLMGLLHHHDYLSTAKNSMMTDREKRQLEVDFKALLVKGHAGIDVGKEKIFNEVAEHTWELNVDFYPLSAYSNKGSNQNLIEEKNKNLIYYVSGAIIAILTIIIILLLL